MYDVYFRRKYVDLYIVRSKITHFSSCSYFSQMQPCILLYVQELQLIFLPKYDYDNDDIKGANFSVPQMNNATKENEDCRDIRTMCVIQIFLLARDLRSSQRYL